MAIQLADLNVNREHALTVMGGWQPGLIPEKIERIFRPFKTKGRIGYFSLQEQEIHSYSKPEESITLMWFINTLLWGSLQDASKDKIHPIIDYKEIYNIGDILCLKEKKEPNEQQQEILFTVASRFGKVEKVKSIYFQKYREELQVQILLSITQYDSALMDTLLDIEYDIRKKYPERVFEFFYPPVGISDKKDFIHSKAQCIYAR